MIAIVAVAVVGPANADVIESVENGFLVRNEVLICSALCAGRLRDGK